MNTGPNYSTYSLEELKDAHSHIDKSDYPERTIQIQNEIKKREAGIVAKQKEGDLPDKVVNNSKEDITSVITVFIKYIFMPVWLVGWSFGLIMDLNFALKHGNYQQHVPGLLLMFGAFIVALFFYYYRVIRLKFVEVDENNLYISTLTKTDKVPLSSIEKFSKHKTRPPFISIELNEESKFGNKIVFIPKLSPIYGLTEEMFDTLSKKLRCIKKQQDSKLENSKS